MGQQNDGTSFADNQAAPMMGTPAPTAPVNTGYDNDYIRVPRQQLADFNGDFHAALGAAGKYQSLGDYAAIAQEFKDANWSPEDVRTFANQWGGGAAREPSQVGITQEQLSQLFQQQEQRTQQLLAQTLTQHTQAVQQATEWQQAIQRGQELTSKAAAKFLEDKGYALYRENEAGEQIVDPFAESVYMRYMDHLQDAMRQNMPEGMSQDQMDVYMASASPEAHQAAAEAMSWVQDLKFNHAAQVASEQEITPSATLGAGPGGKQQPPNYDSMSPDQRKDAVMDGIDIPED